MPPIETIDLHQKAVLWEASGIDSFGEKKVKAAVEISVRWETRHSVVLDSQGNQVGVDSLVITDQNVPLGSILRLGAKADLPSPPDNLKEVVAKTNVPDVKNRNNRRRLSLASHSNELPDTV